MPIKIGQWAFDGPYANVTPITYRSGTYVILGRTPPNATYTVVDVGESGDLRTRLETHDRADCWKRQRHAELAVAVLYCDERSRLLVEQTLRAQFNPACGIR